MSEFESTPLPEAAPKKNNTTMIIIGVVAFLLICCCCVTLPALYWLWENGDSLFMSLLTAFYA
jgi:hypothetical protein